MDYQNKARKFLSYLSEGDIKTPAHWALSQLEGTDLFDSHDHKTVVPSWITTEDKTTLTRYNKSNDVEFYTSTRTSPRSPDITFDPPREFDMINISILDISDENIIEVDYTCVGGDEKKKSIDVSNGGFNERLCLPITVNLEEPATDATVSLRSDSNTSKIRQYLQSSDNGRKITKDPMLSLPALNQSNGGGTPIFLLSIDTFRFDYLDAFDPVIDELGDTAVLPQEPRTQGHWTRPSHASTLTSVHPGEHGYVAAASDDVNMNRISPDLLTLPEYLAERMYKCYGCVTQSSLSPMYGFGRGFHQYNVKNMTWGIRQNDAKRIVSTASQRLNTDSRIGSKNIFYFLHFFDPHYPYIPPYPIQNINNIDINLPERFKNYQIGDDYLTTVRSPPPEVPPKEKEKIKSYYWESLRYTAKHVRMFINELKQSGFFDDAFIAILGDHGEGLYDRKFATHSTLYDENIRPGAILKLPESVDFDIPNKIDHIDLFPTIAHMIGDDYPDQCMGNPWQQEDYNKQYRVTERIRPDSYSVSIESGNIKGIFTYDLNFPNLPTDDMIEEGPEEGEFYRLSALRKENADQKVENISEDIKLELENRAESFASRDIKHTKSVASIQPPEEAKERLKKLGYT